MVRSPRRCAGALLRRHWRLLKRAGPDDGVLRRRVGVGRCVEEDEQGDDHAQILEVADACATHGIIPEFSFVFGDPDDAGREIENTLAFVRR